MSIFGAIEKKEELVLVFDIGSSSVGGSLFVAQKNGIPKIIYSVREPIVLEQKINFDRFLILTLKSLEIVSNKICMMGLGAPKKTYCALASPWYASQTRTILLNKNAPFVFDSKLADNLIEKEVKLFEEECVKNYMHTKSKVLPIELKNMQIMLNGYVVPKPLNQKASELEMTIFVSMSGEQVLEKMKETIGKHFYSKNIKFFSFAIASFAVTRDLFVNQKDFLLIDIGGEVTDISMIKKDILQSSISFSFGRNFLIRGIAGALNCSLNEAMSYLSLYKDGHIADSTLKKIEPIINKLKNEWLVKFQEALVNLSNDISIPASIFLTTDRDLVDLFIETIKSEQFNQYTLTESKFKVIPLTTELFNDVVSYKNSIDRDTFLVLESVYVNRFLHWR